MVQKQVKPAIIAFPNARAKPPTVMIKLLHAVIAHRAVGTPWRSIDKAGLTKFHFPLVLLMDCKKLNHGVGVLRPAQDVLSGQLDLPAARRDYPWVHRARLKQEEGRESL